MAKRNRLYTVNRWNKNLFSGLDNGSSVMDRRNSGVGLSTQRNTGIVSFDSYNQGSASNVGTQRLGSSLTANQSQSNYAGAQEATTYIGGADKNFNGQDDNQSNEGIINSREYKVAEQGADAATNYLSKQMGQTTLKGGTNAALNTGTVLTPVQSALTNTASNIMATQGTQGLANAGQALTNNFASQTGETLMQNAMTQATGKSALQNMTDTAVQGLGSGATSEATKQTALQKFGSLLGGNKAGTAGSIGLGVGAQVVGGVGKSLISDGQNTKTGNNIANIGSLVGGVVGAINPVIGAAVVLASNLVGGVVNAGWGHQVFGKAQAQNYLNNMSGWNAGGSNEQIEAMASQLAAPTMTTYKDGWWTSKGRNESNAINTQLANAFDFAQRSVGNAAQNNASSKLADAMYNYSALGGPIQSATEYGLATDWINTKKQDMQSKSKITSMPNSFFSGGNDTLFAIGGTLQSHGSNWSNGVRQVNAGGTHEQNPHEGVQMSVDPEGKPNMVEEGEVVWNDFVFSNRIAAPKEVRQKYGIRGKKEMSFADVAKKLQKESEERPNDPISEAGLNASLEGLAQAQETLKQEMEAKKAQAAFASLSPEEQQAMMQERAAREQQAAEQQQGMEQQGQDEAGQMMSQLSPEEQQQAQQLAQQLAQNPQLLQQLQGQMAAYGGRLNRFDGGGKMLTNFLKAMGFATKGDFVDWAFSNRINKEDTNAFLDELEKGKGTTDLFKQDKYRNLRLAIVDYNRALDDAISRGYDFGAYNPSDHANDLTFDFQHGGWGSEDYAAWNGSTDAAWKEALEKGLVKEGMNSEEIGKALQQTDAYKKGTDWLKASADNRLKYLQAIYNSNDAPEAAKKFAAKYVDDKGWKDKASTDYDAIFGNVRTTHPGTYWKTPTEVLRGDETTNFVINDDGSVEQIYGDIPDGWKQDNTYSYASPDMNYTYNYYRRPAAAEETGTADNDYMKNRRVVASTKAEWPRYAGLFGPAVGLGMQALGIGKPDYSGLDAAVAASGTTPIRADVEHIGNRLTYNPFDVSYFMNRQNAQTNANRRAIMNSGSTPARGAQVVANNFAHIGNIGAGLRQGQEYNFNMKKEVGEFNKDTDKYNATADNQANLQYASDYNKQKEFNAQMQMQAAQARLNADNNWYNGIYGNVSGLFKGLSDLGKENAQHNVIAKTAAQGLLGGKWDPDSPYTGDFVRYETLDEYNKRMAKQNNAARGGKLHKRHRRGGLTF